MLIRITVWDTVSGMRSESISEIHTTPDAESAAHWAVWECPIKQEVLKSACAGLRSSSVWMTEIKTIDPSRAAKGFPARYGIRTRRLEMDAQTPRNFPLRGWGTNKNADRTAHTAAPAAAQRRKENEKSIIPCR